MLCFYHKIDSDNILLINIGATAFALLSCCV